MVTTFESSRFRYLFSFFLGAIWLFLYLQIEIGYVESVGYISSVLLLTTAFWLVLRAFFAKNTLLLLVFSFVFLYAIPTKLYFFDKILLSMHNKNFTDETVSQVTLIFALFLIVINAFLKISVPPRKVIVKYKNNAIVFWIIIILSIIFIVIGKSGESLLSGYAYGQAEQSSSSLNEYVLILFLFAYIYSGGHKINLNIICVLAFVYALKNILYGGRIEIVMLALMFFTLHLQYVISFKKAVLFFIVGIWIMQTLGTIRGNPQLLIEGDIVSILNPFVGDNTARVYQNSNEGDVYWASERMFLLMKDGELNAVDRVESATCFALSVFAPMSLLPEVTNLSNYKMDVRTTGGGGLAPVFFYVFGGLVGVVLLGVFVALQLNSLENKNSMVRFVYVTLLVTTLPRWFAYYPIHLIKFCLWGVLGYILVISLDYTIKKYLNRTLHSVQ